jgi:hypothetical protein
VARDDGLLHCHRVLDSLDERLVEIDRRIAALLALRETLVYIRDEAKALPQNQRCDEQCVCYLITTDHSNGQITIQREKKERT